MGNSLSIPEERPRSPFPTSFTNYTPPFQPDHLPFSYDDEIPLWVPRMDFLNSNPRPPLRQPQSRFLSLPAELRLNIYQFMDLPPMPGKGEWVGCFFTCRQIKQEMQHEALKQYEPFHKELVARFKSVHSATIAESAQDVCRTLALTISLPDPRGCSFPRRRQSLQDHGFDMLFLMLYSLPLNKLDITFQDEASIRGSSQRAGVIFARGPGMGRVMRPSNFKHLTGQIFDPYMRKEKINCRQVMFTLEALAKQKDGMTKSITLRNFASPELIPYSLTIVETASEGVSRRTFTSPSRFKSRFEDESDIENPCSLS
jgi:hypothetical protein